MTTIRSTRFVGAVGVLLALTSYPSTASATHINPAIDVAGLRTGLGPGEGLLHFRDSGEETTGWTDVRHPANDGTNFVNLIDSQLGFDRSDHFVQVHNKIVTADVRGAEGLATVTANPNIPRDFDFANQIYAQAGISVLSTGVQNVDHSTGNGQGNAVVADPLWKGVPAPDDIDRVQVQNRVAGPVVNNWYATSDSDGDRGVTSPPSAFPATSGTMIFDTAVNDTFAHELGHFLLDRNKFSNPDTDHSPAASDLMAGGNPRLIPGNAQKEDGNTAPSEPGQHVGNIGTKDHFEASVKLNGAGPDIDQLQAIASSPAVQKNHNPGAGDHVDFDWVQDHIPIEVRAPAADNHNRVDYMVWEIAPLVNSLGAAHDHGNWLSGGESELSLNAFGNPFFQLVDVVSQIARYEDQDVNNLGNWARRESALDYLLDFSANGQDWVAGTPIIAFIEGWTLRSQADNWLVRWQTDIEARFVRTAPFSLGGNHDGNAQIDAIVAWGRTIPEPASLTLFASGLVLLLLCQHRARHFSRGNIIDRG